MGCSWRRLRGDRNGIDGDGNQQATYQDSDFDALPIQPALDAGGGEVHVTVELPDRTVEVKVWQVRVGHVCR